VAANAIELALNGTPRKSFYLTGRVGDETIALHAQGSRVVLTKADGSREEVDLAHEGQRAGAGAAVVMPDPVAVCGPVSGAIGAEVAAEETAMAAPGSSPLDGALEILAEGLTSAGASAKEGGRDDLGPGGDGRDDVGRDAEGRDEDEGAAGVLVPA
jgi:hypothetical protein